MCCLYFLSIKVIRLSWFFLWILNVYFMTSEFRAPCQCYHCCNLEVPRTLVLAQHPENPWAKPLFNVLFLCIWKNKHTERTCYPSRCFHLQKCTVLPHRRLGRGEHHGSALPPAGLGLCPPARQSRGNCSTAWERQSLPLIVPFLACFLPNALCCDHLVCSWNRPQAALKQKVLRWKFCLFYICEEQIWYKITSLCS